MKYLILALLGAALAMQLTSPTILLQMQALSDNVIDDGLGLLQALLDNAEHELQEVVEGNDLALQHLKGELNNHHSSLHEAESECMAISDDLALLDSRYLTHKDDIKLYEQYIQANRNRASTLEGLRCKSSTEWLNFLKSSKYILRFIEFMRSAIQNYNSFAEIHNFGIMLQKVMDPLFLQQEEEINDQSIIESLTAINNSKNISGAKQELLLLLDQIEKSIKAKMNASQTNEIVTSMRLGDYLAQLNKEVVYFEGEIEILTGLFSDHPESGISLKKKELDDCEDRLKVKIASTHTYEQNIDNRVVHNQELESSLLRQKDIVQEIIDEYSRGLEKISDTYKLRVHDYAEDGVFDKTPDFDKHQLTDNFADKENNLNEYIESVLKGEQQPVKVEIDLEKLKQAQEPIVVEESSEETSEGTSEEEETVEAEAQVEEDVTEDVTEEVAANDEQEGDGEDLPW